MLIKNGNLLIDKAFSKLDIEFGERITFLGHSTDIADFDAEGLYIVPGLIDIHTHGAVNEDFSDGKREGLVRLSEYYASKGVTSYLATTMTLGEDELTNAMHNIRVFKPSKHHAKCIGINLEGPFLSYQKRGAQKADKLHKPSFELFLRLNEASGNLIRLVTVAPEESDTENSDNALNFIRKVSRLCTVSIGHSAANYDLAMAAFKAGASHITHLFNGMPPLHHRSPGIIGAAIDSNASAELICDGIHVHPSVVRAAHRLFGDKLILISDSLRCAGMPDGNYELGGQAITVKNGAAALLDGTIAGSSISLMDAVRNAVRFGLSREEALYAASTAPAKTINAAGIGKICVGKASDLLVLDRDLNIIAVFINGLRVQSK